MTSPFIGWTILATSTLNLIAMVVAARIIRQVAAEWRRQHRLRTPIAAAYGMAEVLHHQETELPLTAREKLYEALIEQLREALAAADAGTVLKDGQ